MSMSARPGGLSALAIVNFCFAGLGFLGNLFALLFVLSLLGAEPSGQADLFWASLELAVSVLLNTLLLISGIGYLRLSGSLGRWMGNAYALLRLAWIPVQLFLLEEYGYRFGMGTILGMVYPLITLIQLNLTFRDLWRQDGWMGSRPPNSPPATSPLQPPGSIARILLAWKQSLRQYTRGASGLLFVLTTLICSSALAGGLIGARNNIDSLFTPPASQEQAPPPADLPAAAFLERSLLAWMIGEMSWQDFTHQGSLASEAEFQDNTPGFVHMMDETALAIHYPRTAHLALSQPATLSIAWVMMSRLLLPLLVVLGAFNQLSGDIRHRGLRFVLSRIDRPSLLYGRFAATLSLIWLTLAVMVCTVAAYALFHLEGAQLATVLCSALFAWFVLALTALPYIALCLWISSCIDSSFASLLLGECLVIVAPLALMISASVWPQTAFALWILPSAGQLYFFHHQPLIIILASLGMLAYSVFFLWLARRHFVHRDL